ncbi:DUF5959 family protein [Actinomadura parmotrematis]|uniref:YbjN domain-containing protein n=1 Tax=Actinomadura parmotrematis TaxID=2864039 RepID=A0ABS7FN76_9ACTN|nr:DUF5959 family protein [Actinomadura parmotrematis]MBW8481837.1 hypothetical protein [Actinomadura parmotrematis]
MTNPAFPDLIDLADDLGDSVVLRISHAEDGCLVGEIEVRSPFVGGRLLEVIHPDCLDDWEVVLDDLARGDNTAWREGRDRNEIWIEEDEGGPLRVTVVDAAGSLASAELLIEVADDWLDDHYDRLDAVRDAWSGLVVSG